jgi:hypothetical protein
VEIVIPLVVTHKIILVVAIQQRTLVTLPMLVADATLDVGFSLAEVAGDTASS